MGKNLKKKVNPFCLERFSVSGAAWGRVLEGDKSGLGVTLCLFPSQLPCPYAPQKALPSLSQCSGLFSRLSEIKVSHLSIKYKNRSMSV